jgi:hypothetical protein
MNLPRLPLKMILHHPDSKLYTSTVLEKAEVVALP